MLEDTLLRLLITTTTPATMHSTNKIIITMTTEIGIDPLPFLPVNNVRILFLLHHHHLLDELVQFLETGLLLPRATLRLRFIINFSNNKLSGHHHHPLVVIKIHDEGVEDHHHHHP